jgi:hypothetical protein
MNKALKKRKRDSEWYGNVQMKAFHFPLYTYHFQHAPVSFHWQGIRHGGKVASRNFHIRLGKINESRPLFGPFH